MCYFLLEVFQFLFCFVLSLVLQSLTIMIIGVLCLFLFKMCSVSWTCRLVYLNKFWKCSVSFFNNISTSPLFSFPSWTLIQNVASFVIDPNDLFFSLNLFFFYFSNYLNSFFWSLPSASCLSTSVKGQCHLIVTLLLSPSGKLFLSLIVQF